MTSSRSFAEQDLDMVADASVAINLVATKRIEEIIRAVPHRFVITSNACRELDRGLIRGHEEGLRIRELIDKGLVYRVELGPSGQKIFDLLVSGSTQDSLDDGESATIGYSVEQSAVALIDERKATRIFAERFPEYRVMSTVELLLGENVSQALGKSGQCEAIWMALKDARMRVPDIFVSDVVRLIGAKRAELCSSLRLSARIA